MAANICCFNYQKEFVKKPYIQIFDFNLGQNNFCQFFAHRKFFLQELFIAMPTSDLVDKFLTLKNCQGEH